MAYAQLFNFNYQPAQHAANLYKYHSRVFIFPAWKAIYTTDDERKMSFEAAKAFGDSVQKIYQDLGYQLIEVPRISPEERAKFIIEYFD